VTSYNEIRKRIVQKTTIENNMRQMALPSAMCAANCMFKGNNFETMIKKYEFHSHEKFWNVLKGIGNKNVYYFIWKSMKK
jgi:hypothetical protein